MTKIINATIKKAYNYDIFQTLIPEHIFKLKLETIEVGDIVFDIKKYFQNLMVKGRISSEIMIDFVQRFEKVIEYKHMGYDKYYGNYNDQLIRIKINEKNEIMAIGNILYDDWLDLKSFVNEKYQSNMTIDFRKEAEIAYKVLMKKKEAEVTYKILMEKKEFWVCSYFDKGKYCAYSKQDKECKVKNKMPREEIDKFLDNSNLVCSCCIEGIVKNMENFDFERQSKIDELKRKIFGEE